MKKLEKLKGYAFGAWALLVIAVIIGFVRLEALGHQNQERINDIQQSRLISCVTTYKSFHAVFDPFFPPSDKRTAKQKRDLAKFDRILATKIKQCRFQVTPPPVPKKTTAKE